MSFITFKIRQQKRLLVIFFWIVSCCFSLKVEAQDPETLRRVTSSRFTKHCLWCYRGNSKTNCPPRATINNLPTNRQYRTRKLRIIEFE